MAYKDKKYKVSWKYANKNNMVAIEITVDKLISSKDKKQEGKKSPSGLNIVDLYSDISEISKHYIYVNQEDIANYRLLYLKDYESFKTFELEGELSFGISYFLLFEEFMNFYMEYVEKFLELRVKYTKRFRYISRIHKKFIKENDKLEKNIETYKKGTSLGETGHISLEKSKGIKVQDKHFRKINVGGNSKYYKNYTDTNVKYLLRMMKKIRPYTKSFTVWKGVKLGNLEIGNVIEQNLPFTASILPYVARDFVEGTCCLLEINIPEEYKVIFCNSMTKLREEIIIFPSNLIVYEKITIKKKDLYKYLGDEPFPLLGEFFGNDIHYSSDIDILKCNIEELTTF